MARSSIHLARRIYNAAIVNRSLPLMLSLCVLLLGAMLVSSADAARYGPLLRRSRAQALKQDMDQDGIPDVFDKCPGQAEDPDGFEDLDGCPDPDNDGDRILDRFDGCPNQPEDLDGFEDLGGCPDLDNDQDGLLDTNDRCPDEAEVFNDYEDEDGCPD